MIFFLRTSPFDPAIFAASNANFLRSPKHETESGDSSALCGMLVAGLEPAPGGLLTRKGDRVRFSISDAFLPAAEELAAAAEPDEKLEGTVIDFSDSGPELSYFAVIDVIRRRTIVVPVEKVEILQGNRKDLPNTQF
jgi:hypothetical protein